MTFTRKEDKEIYLKTIDNKLHLSPKIAKFSFSGILGDSIKGKQIYGVP